MGKLETFNRKRCVKALLKAGFFKKNKRSGGHDKFIPPNKYLGNQTNDQPPFIMVPRSRVLHCQDEIVKELRNLGGDDLVKQFADNL